MKSRIATQKSTGRVLEFQTGEAPLGTLKSNAIKAGFAVDDVDEKYIDSEEFEAIRPKPTPKPKRDIEKEIDDLKEALKAKGIL